METLVPFSPLAEDLKLQCDASRQAGALRFAFVLSGAVEKIKIPHFVPAARGAFPRRDGLWKTTCFEAFVSPRASENYWELNFSPSGAWNCYRFDGYRKGMRIESDARSIEIQPRAGLAGYQLHAAIDLSPLIEKGPIDVSLTAVIDGMSHSYWALKHAGGVPDFHLRESFVLKL